MTDFSEMSSLLEGVLPDVAELSRLSGGASRETWAFTSAGKSYIIQRDRPGGLRRAPLVTELAALQAAGRALAPVPTIVATGPDWFITQRVSGETIARRIQRDDCFVDARRAFAAACGHTLAAIHSVSAEAVPDLPTESVETWRQSYQQLGMPRPVFELVLRWLAMNVPPSQRHTLVHGDFRLGNLVVNRSGIRAVLDWEMVHAGDPVEDLGYLCVRSWRFGGRLPVGGIATREDLLAAYEQASGFKIDLRLLRWWELYGTMRWGVIALQQLDSHLSGVERSIELAAIGRRICEIEHDMLALLS
jgi:aminoglycoside phosphotransferase (APT) family kinase protein